MFHSVPWKFPCAALRRKLYGKVWLRHSSLSPTRCDRILLGWNKKFVDIIDIWTIIIVCDSFSKGTGNQGFVLFVFSKQKLKIIFMYLKYTSCHLFLFSDSRPSCCCCASWGRRNDCWNSHCNQGKQWDNFIISSLWDIATYQMHNIVLTTNYIYKSWRLKWSDDISLY